MIHIAICDDEQNDINRTADILRGILAKQKRDCRIHTFLSAAKLLGSVEALDIGILDIAMDEINGIELGRRLKEKFPEIRLIYTTSYKEYCIQAINDVHAFSYLCKPIDASELARQLAVILADIPDTVVEKSFYHVTDSRGKEYPVISLPLKDILYFTYIKRQRRAAIVLAQETYECQCRFAQLTEELESCHFTVNSRGMLVNLCHVERIRGNTLCLDNGDELPIAQKRAANFKKILHAFLQSRS